MRGDEARLLEKAMSRYWVIAPVEADPPEQYDKVWQFNLANNLISIGWKQLGDVSSLSRQELASAVAVKYPDRPQQTKTLITNMIWAFYHEIKPGDVVLARRGRRVLAGVGTVEHSATYQPGLVPVVGYPNVLPVSWSLSPRNKIFSSIVFPMHTLSEISDEKATELLRDSPMAVIAEEDRVEVEDFQTFALEKYLEEFIVSNFDSIFKGELKLFRDSEGNAGQQYDTDVGPIDILAVERDSNAFVVIELKKGRPSDQVVGQILRYMGWVKSNLCEDGRTVTGLVICRDQDPKLDYALSVTCGISVKYYSVAFKLLDIASKKL
jgi:restriction system protein